MSVPQKYAAVVVGAGPAGLAVMGNLLERKPAGKVAWIDPVFQGGRVNRKYREVPSNTKVKLFLEYAKAVEPFRKIVKDTPSPNPFTTLQKLDQENTCHLYHAADMTQALTDGVGKMDQVSKCRGFVTAANLADKVSSLISWDLSSANSVERDLDSQRQTQRIQGRNRNHDSQSNPLHRCTPNKRRPPRPWPQHSKTRPRHRPQTQRPRIPTS